MPANRHVARQTRTQRLPCTVASITIQRPETKGQKPSGHNLPADGSSQVLDKPRVVILGSGWAAVSLVKALNKSASKQYDITLISPRNYFLYTPLLPAVASGTVEERSIVEPIRKIASGKGRYFEAVCESIDPNKRTLVACFPQDVGLAEACFKVPFDLLVLAVGSVTNTFGIEGVEEHCFFFKDISDAHRLRRHVSECFERASLPATTPEERRSLLSFVVVGGGPTGVEVAAELHDMLLEDMRRIYPALMSDVHICIIDTHDHVLSTYDRAISEYASNEFRRSGIEMVLHARVSAVHSSAVDVVHEDGRVTELASSTTIWATGVAMHPLVKQLQEKLPPGLQTHFRSITTDEYLRVKGSGGTIFALGDAATIEQDKAMDHASELFERADTHHHGKLNLDEVRAIVRAASKEYTQFKEYLRFLDGHCGAKRFGGMVARSLQAAHLINQPHRKPAADDPLWGDLAFDEQTQLTREQFTELLRKIDKGLRALPATGQVAKQQGEYLARLMATSQLAPSQPLPPQVKPFHYRHKGQFAYVGRDRAVVDAPLAKAAGISTGLLWRSFETISQISLRNMMLVSIDWLRTKLFGRDISRV
ncbi:hypothetical protein WJX72_007865 [[Myrmecia] bisecta]|uniref:NADH:ubiquinone reductase (non-electrogenic) n=1 Tax=[Myrmecia] bisecta TaxID=41462 RepID=A0AAW1Q4C8_9CHLO